MRATTLHHLILSLLAPLSTFASPLTQEQSTANGRVQHLPRGLPWDPRQQVATTPDSILAIANKWRTKIGVGKYAWSPTLQGNAYKTATKNIGTEMHHIRFPGTAAQVLATGNDTLSDFEFVWVLGFLCEEPNIPGLGDVCKGSPWKDDGEKGHAEILKDPAYKSIGCAVAMPPSSTKPEYPGQVPQGIWACDFSP